jgi:hypothetical protein
MITLACSYCDVQSLRVLDSAGAGIVFGGGATEANSFATTTHRIIDNEVGPSAWGNFLAQGSHHDFISGNTFHDGGVAGRQGDNRGGADGGGALIGTFISPEVPGAANSVFNNIDTLFEKNDLYNARAEGMIVSQVGHVILRGNRVSGSNQVGGIYTQTCGNCVYEYNLLYGGKPNDRTAPMAYGIGIVAENGSNPPFGILPETDIIIRGNMVAHSSNCILVHPDAVAIGLGIKINIKAYNNTCIDMPSGAQSGVLVKGDGVPMTGANVGAKGIQFKNNIFYNEIGVTGQLCNGATQGAEIGIVWDYNFWGSTPNNTNCRGAHDLTGNPQLIGSGFNLKTHWTAPPTTAEFGLQSGSPAIGRGTPMTATILTAAEFPIAIKMAYPCAVFDLKGSVIDAACASRGASPEMGALARGGSQTPLYELTVD